MKTTLIQAAQKFFFRITRILDHYAAPSERRTDLSFLYQHINFSGLN